MRLTWFCDRLTCKIAKVCSQADIIHSDGLGELKQQFCIVVVGSGVGRLVLSPGILQHSACLPSETVSIAMGSRYPGPFLAPASCRETAGKFTSNSHMATGRIIF